MSLRADGRRRPSDDWKRYAYAAGKCCQDCSRPIMDVSTRCQRCSLKLRNATAVPRYGPDHHGWKGGRGIGSDGYAWVLVDGEQRKEHVLIAEKILGRKLKWRQEVVHHINGDKTDNRHCNLLICTSAYHRQLHDRMGRMWQEEHFPKCFQ